MADEETLKSGHKRTHSHVENITEPLTGTGNTEIQKPDQNTVAIDISSSTPKCDSEFENTNLAIELSDTFKDYGSGKSRLPVLIGLNMNVVRGQIYGLLGPSGCGKTTLLKCIVGKLKVDSGLVHVFGEPPGPKSKSGVPGRRVGYMPQELALFDEFSITETLIYFARLYGMTHAKFKERLDFLMDFLDLPSKTRALINMSGGQQRRHSALKSQK